MAEASQPQAVENLKLQTIPVAVAYAFKSVAVKDSAGNEVKEIIEGKEQVKKIRRDTLQDTIPVPTLESLFGVSLPKKVIPAVLAKDEKGNEVISEPEREEYLHPEHQAIFEMIAEDLKGVGKAIVDETESNDQVKFPEGTFDFAVLSRKPKYERKGGSVQRELLEELCDSYSDAMKHLGKPEKGVKIACAYFMRRAKGLDAVKTDIVEKMRANLGSWFTGIDEDNQGKFAQAYELLDKRIGEALAVNADEVM